MINARQELISALEQVDKVRPADVVAFNIQIKDCHDGILHSCKGTTLTPDALEKLDVVYDNGFGSQHLFGYVLFNDNTWLSRHEYDGSEWWEYNHPPTVEEVLNFGA